MGSPLKSAYLLRAKPVALIISYHTRGFVEEEKNGCSIGQPFIYKKYVMRGSSQVTTLIIPRPGHCPWVYPFGYTLG